MTGKVFVFGSNMAGQHYGGSAAAALAEHGAIWGLAVGPAGNSYAIPTLSGAFEKLPLEIIDTYVRQFIGHAEENPELRFNVVAIGCGIAGFTPDEIAPMFKGAPSNCDLPLEFKAVLNV